MSSHLELAIGLFLARLAASATQAISLHAFAGIPLLDVQIVLSLPRLFLPRAVWTFRGSSLASFQRAKTLFWAQLSIRGHIAECGHILSLR